MRNVNNSRSLVRKPLSQTQLHKKLALKYYIHGKKNPQVDINLDINVFYLRFFTHTHTSKVPWISNLKSLIYKSKSFFY